MRKYETVFISDPDLQDQARVDLFDKVRNIIAQENGIFLNFDEWGNKKLAYEIKKKLRGHYVCVTYGGTGDLIKELERNFRLSDDVMKFMTILLSDDVTAEQLEKEALEAENQSKQVDEIEEKSVEEETVEEKADKESAEEETSKEDEKVEETKKETE
ncbi:30S ribosomal protein S6 [Desulfobacula sp.]|uniref:30S ribosomal protein S6 n=1 Tax=Desulfobacula sp. TaxID=2593537 RepID=UPI00262FF2C9|nr:30S ribosomal protein S6 [Desulfobacula sp.]